MCGSAPACWRSHASTAGFVPPAWVLKPDGPGSLPQRFREFLPDEVLKRLDALPPWGAPMGSAGPPPPLQFVELLQPTNTLHAPPYRPDSPWVRRCSCRAATATAATGSRRQASAVSRVRLGRRPCNGVAASAQRSHSWLCHAGL